jgi:hypothetical protein
MDGDGSADVVVGCEYESGVVSSGGAAYLVYGSPSGAMDLSSAATARFYGTSSGEYFAWPTAVPDVDGDGYDELLIGGRYYNGGVSSQGRAGLFYGGSW